MTVHAGRAGTWATILVLVATVGVAVGSALTTTIAAETAAARARADQSLTIRHALETPCPTEDSDDCYWDAATMGNGQGVSFVSISGVTYPLP